MHPALPFVLLGLSITAATATTILVVLVSTLLIGLCWPLTDEEELAEEVVH